MTTPTPEIYKHRFYIVRHLEDGKREVIRQPSFTSWRKGYDYIKSCREYDGEITLRGNVLPVFFINQGKWILTTKRLHSLIP